jgi:hypothetical protein
VSDNLANLAKIGKLKAEAFSETEFKGIPTMLSGTWWFLFRCYRTLSRYSTKAS